MKHRSSILLSSLFGLGVAGAAPGQVYSFDVPGFGTLGDGAAVAVGQIGGTSRPDMLLLANDDGAPANQVRYRLLRDLSAAGTPAAILPPVGWHSLPVSMGDGSEGLGAAIVSLDADPRPELIVMSYDIGTLANPANNCRWFVAFNLNGDGTYTSIGPVNSVAGFGNDGDGAGVAIGQIDGLTGPDIVFMAYDVGAPTNQFRYKIGFNLNAIGVPATWSTTYAVSGLGQEADGADVALTQIDSDPRPDLVLMAYDDPAGANSFRVKIGLNLNNAGIPSRWIGRPQTDVSMHGAQVAGSPEGAGCAAINLDVDPRMDFVFVAYDTGGSAAAANFFRIVWQRNWTGASSLFGTGCGSPPPLLQVAPGVIPSENSLLSMRLDNVSGSAIIGVLIDIGAPATPVSLASAGLPGCNLYASMYQIGMSFNLPPATAGLAFHAQGFGFSLSGPPSVSLSQRCDIIIGH